MTGARLLPSTPGGTARRQIAERREQIHQVHQRVASPLLDAGAGKDQRHVHAAELVEVLLAEQAVLAERQAVVAGEDDDGVVELAEFPKQLENASDVVVQAGDAGVVLRELAPGVFRRPGPRGKMLVADGHLAIVERVQREEGRGQGDLVRVVEGHEFGRRDARIVRHGRGQVDVERPIRRPLPQELR